MSETATGHTGQPETGVRRVRERRSPSRGIRRRGLRDEVLPADRLDVATLDWFLVRVLAGQEMTARDILRAAGFGTCLPMQRKWQRANRYHKRREQREYAVLPGYLFVGMSAQTPGWPVLVEPRQVVSVVGLDGRPCRIAKAMIDAIVAQYDSLYYPCPVAERPALDYAAGDMVQVTDGPFDRHVVKVERIGAKSATVLVKMFGRDMAVQVGLDALVKKA